MDVFWGDVCTTTRGPIATPCDYDVLRPFILLQSNILILATHYSYI